jgi:hypothetical protein
LPGDSFIFCLINGFSLPRTFISLACPSITALTYWKILHGLKEVHEIVGKIKERARVFTTRINLLLETRNSEGIYGAYITVL